VKFWLCRRWLTLPQCRGYQPDGSAASANLSERNLNPGSWLTRLQLPVVGFLNGGSPDMYADLLRAFRRGWKETGYGEGQNLVIKYPWAEGHNDRLSAFATDLVRRRVALIVAGGTPSVLAAKEATAAISDRVFVAGNPVELGLVARPNRARRSSSQNPRRSRTAAQSMQTGDRPRA
jgi:hypothetical protein